MNFIDYEEQIMLEFMNFAYSPSIMSDGDVKVVHVSRRYDETSGKKATKTSKRTVETKPHNLRCWMKYLTPQLLRKQVVNIK